MLKDTFLNVNHNSYSGKFWDNSKCKCDQGKATLDGMDFRVSKIIYKDICIKVNRLWGWYVRQYHSAS